MKRAGADRKAADAALARALLAGDPRAARQAWISLSPLVQRMLNRRFTGSPDQQDLCQEVFLRFFTRIGELRDRGALRGFLVGICLGVAQNELRCARVRRRAIRFVPIEETERHAIAPFDAAGRQAIGRLCAVLDSVSPEDRALFAVRHVQKMELTEIAATRGWSVTTTKRRLKRVTRRVGLRLQREPSLVDYARALRL
ncbi:MAG TPA: sigma-70 family RNA polymerase sigma factor [Polyangia bacterium]|nr:sigma-70 family RNA polymerase sigma factor [Polyangia bacterium]